jgi:DNA (cytosine-5)-methyltransferase 1
MKSKDPLTYISLFVVPELVATVSLENYSCVATVEILQKRIAIQRYNKCKYDSAYISDDITTLDVKLKFMMSY